MVRHDWLKLSLIICHAWSAWDGPVTPELWFTPVLHCSSLKLVSSLHALHWITSMPKLHYIWIFTVVVLLDYVLIMDVLPVQVCVQFLHIYTILPYLMFIDSSKALDNVHMWWMITGSHRWLECLPEPYDWAWTISLVSAKKLIMVMNTGDL